MFKHKYGVLNKVIDALSRKMTFLIIMQATVSSFDLVKDLYVEDANLRDIWYKLGIHESVGEYHIFQGHLFKVQQLCIP